MKNRKTLLLASAVALGFTLTTTSAKADQVVTSVVPMEAARHGAAELDLRSAVD